MTSPAQFAPEPDEALKQGFAAGAPDAVDRMVVHFHRDVLRFCLSMTGDQEMGFEAAQETFLRLLEMHRTFDPARAFRPWLFGVCRRCCSELFRQRNRSAARVIDMVEGEDPLAALEDDAPSPLDELLRTEREAEALTALAVLPNEEREIVLLHIFERLKFREIADTLDRPLPTIATVYYRAMKRLREHLDSSKQTRQERKGGHAG